MFNSIELFAGCGGLALGLERAGFNHIMLNEIDKNACKTLRINRPKWNLIEGDIKNISFKEYYNLDLITGGFPCQSFSYAGKRMGLDDTRGTLFYEFARAINEVKPKIFLGENVKGLLKHDNGNTLKVIRDIIESIGYTLVTTLVDASLYNVPQKRERLLLFGLRNDLFKNKNFKFYLPESSGYISTLKDGLKSGKLYSTDCPKSEGYQYSKSKYDVLKLVPPGGYWKDLPLDIQKSYMGKSYYSGGGKTGIARRLTWNKPCLTLTCSPAQKQTERCHPDETRPLTVREYARIQTFPDEWIFEGSLSSKYKQIGNAVPVNLAYYIGCSLRDTLKSLEGA